MPKAKLSSELEKFKEKYDGRDRVGSIEETSLNNGRIPALQVTGKYGDMPASMMLDLTSEDKGEFADSLAIHQIYGGLRVVDDEKIPVPVAIIVER